MRLRAKGERRKSFLPRSAVHPPLLPRRVEAERGRAVPLRVFRVDRRIILGMLPRTAARRQGRQRQPNQSLPCVAAA